MAMQVEDYINSECLGSPEMLNQAGCEESGVYDKFRKTTLAQSGVHGDGGDFGVIKDLGDMRHAQRGSRTT